MQPLMFFCFMFFLNEVLSLAVSQLKHSDFSSIITSWSKSITALFQPIKQAYTQKSHFNFCMLTQTISTGHLQDQKLLGRRPNQVLTESNHPPKTVFTTSTNDTFLESLGKDLPNPTYIGLICWVILTPKPNIGLTKPSQTPSDLHKSFIPFQKHQDKAYPYIHKQ